MIIKLDELKPICSKILFALDPSNTTELSDVLQIKAEGTFLSLTVTNGEYFVEVKLPGTDIASFNATVNADSFLKLIPLFTKEEINLYIKDQALRIECDGKYKLPLIYKNENMLELPKIEISNVTSNFEIETTILKSILNYNSREFNKGTAVRPVQSLYYIDEKGALTFTTGACVNNFALPAPIRILLNQKLVRLFKLFEEDKVNFSLGTDKVGEGFEQTKVKFETPNIVIIAKINCEEKLMNSFPVSAIRGRSQTEYPYNISINKNILIKALNRLLVFDKSQTPICNLNFEKDRILISNSGSLENTEEIFYEAGDLQIDAPYEVKLNLKDFKLTLENCTEQFIVLGFGNHETITVTKNNILTILPEQYG